MYLFGGSTGGGIIGTLGSDDTLGTLGSGGRMIEYSNGRLGGESCDRMVVKYDGDRV